MGCSSSSEGKIEGMRIGPEALLFLKETTGLPSSDLRTLYRYFKKIDLDGTGLIDFDEFCVRIKCEETVFLHSIFSFFITDINSDSLTFPEFVIFVCYWASLNEHGLAKLCFYILAHDDAHAMSVKQIKYSIKHLMRRAAYNHKKHRLRIPLRELDVDHSGVVTLPEFMYACQHNKSLLFPITAYQMDVQNKIGRSNFWEPRKDMLGNRLRDIFSIREDLGVVMSRERRGHDHHNTDEIDIDLEEA